MKTICWALTDDVNITMLGVATSKCRRLVDQIMNGNPFVYTHGLLPNLGMRARAQ